MYAPTPAPAKAPSPAPTSARFLRSIELSPVISPATAPAAAPMTAWRWAFAGRSSRVYGSNVVHAEATKTPTIPATTVLDNP